MRHRTEIELEAEEKLDGAKTQEAMTNHLLIFQQEILLDIRDLLSKNAKEA